jgi:hypothetical protein
MHQASLGKNMRANQGALWVRCLVLRAFPSYSQLSVQSLH